MLKNLSTSPTPPMSGSGHNSLQNKLRIEGRRALTELELLTLILNSRGNRKNIPLKFYEVLQNASFQWNELGNFTTDELMHEWGFTLGQSTVILAAVELSLRQQGKSTTRFWIKHSSSAFELMLPRLSNLPHEEFHVAFLNRSNRVVRCEIFSMGGISGTVVDIRLILSRALVLKASSILMAHNHPSGNLKPSEEDISLTKKVLQAAKLLDILVIDHLIIADSKYYSFADEGLI